MSIGLSDRLASAHEIEVFPQLVVPLSMMANGFSVAWAAELATIARFKRV